MQDVVIQVLLFFGVAVCLASSAGLLVMRGMYDKLHYLAPMSTVGAGAIILAILLHQGLSWSSMKALLLLLILCASSAILTQATARAMNRRAARLQPKGK